MENQQNDNYLRIEKAINYITANFKDQPDLDEIAEQINVSPFHFQRLFTEWAGTSPKKFLQFISVEYAKGLLADNKATLLNTAFETGLSGTGRLHDLFINIEGMTPAEYKNGGIGLVINHSFAETPFGDILIASTPKGVCSMTFESADRESLIKLKERFPAATFEQKTDIHQQNALFIFRKDNQGLKNIKLHLKGTDFQLKVWSALLKIPSGSLSTYGEIAATIKNPAASRAVGTAIGSNPVAYLIPCHRVIRSTGVFGGYMWGTNRKTAMIGWEAAKINDIS